MDKKRPPEPPAAFVNCQRPMDAKCFAFAFECICPTTVFLSALCKGGGIHAQHGWWVSSPLGCVSIQKNLPLADGILLQKRDDRATRLRRSCSSPTVPISTGRAFRGAPGLRPLLHRMNRWLPPYRELLFDVSRPLGQPGWVCL